MFVILDLTFVVIMTFFILFSYADRKHIPVMQLLPSILLWMTVTVSLFMVLVGMFQYIVYTNIVTGVLLMWIGAYVWWKVTILPAFLRYVALACGMAGGGFAGFQVVLLFHQLMAR